MNEDTTRNLNGDEKLNHLIVLVGQMSGELRGFGKQLESLEEKVDRRLMETRPIWEAVRMRLDGMDTHLEGIATRFDGMDMRLDGIDARLNGIDARLDGIDVRLDGVDGRLNKLESNVTDLKTEMAEGFYKFSEKVQVLLEDVMDVRSEQRRLKHRMDKLESKPQ